MNKRGIFLSVGVIIIMSCGGPAKKFSTVESHKQYNQKEKVLISKEGKEFVVDSLGATDSFPAEIDGLISTGLSLCSFSDFNGADSVLVEALKKIRDYSENISVDSSSYVDEWLRRIATIYCNNFPDTFTYPDDIAIQVIELKMSEVIDSLRISKEDSLYLNGFFNRTNVTYDIPMVWNSRVQQALYYYLTHSNSTVRYWGRRMKPYILFIKKMITDSGLPSDLSYLPIIESCFNPRAISRSYASGIWQFIKTTGKRYGLRCGYWLDERRDPVLSTKAAISYLKKLYNEFGDWHLVLAAYNSGEGCVSRAIKQNNTTDYWKLSLPKETMNYVPLFLASLIIVKNSDFPDLQIADEDTFPYDTVYINHCLDLKEISDFIGVDYDTIKSINPHILHWCTPPDMSDVVFYIPKGKGMEFRDSFLPLADKKRVKWATYRVRKGDNLLVISRRFGVDVEAIKSVNRMKNNKIIAGEDIFLPLPNRDINVEKYLSYKQPMKKIPEKSKLIVYEVKNGDTMWKIAELFGATVDEICLWNNLPNTIIKVGDVLSIYVSDEDKKNMDIVNKKEEESRENIVKHVVEKGENAFRIAKKYSIPLGFLYDINNIDPKNPVVREGDTLLIAKNVTSGGAIQQEVTKSKSIMNDNSQNNYIKYVVSEGDNLFRISQNFSVDIEKIKNLNHISSNSIIKVGDTLILPVSTYNKGKIQSYKEDIVYYIVKEGDTLWRIANMFGISVDRLIKYNGLDDNPVIMPGEKLKIMYQRGEM